MSSDDELNRIREAQRKLERDIKFNKLQFLLSGALIGFGACYIVRSLFEVLSP